MMDLRGFLHGLPAFERFNERQLDALVGQLHLETHAPGAVLIQQDTQGPELYIVMAGAIAVTHRDVDGNEDTEVHEARPGELVGRLSLVPNMPSPVTCSVVSETTVAALTPDRYHALFILAPGVAHQFQYMIAAQLAHYLQSKNKALRQRLVRRVPPSLLERLFGV